MGKEEPKIEESKTYKRIVKLKPIIESNEEVIKQLKDCFNYSQRPNSRKPKGLAIKGGSRYVFQGFNPIIDPITNKKEHFVLKNGVYSFNPSDVEDIHHSALSNLEWLCAEIAHLENKESKDLSLLAVVLDFRHDVAGLLMTDYSMGGKYRIVPVGENGDRLMILDGKKEPRTVWADMKREGYGFKEGIKYFNKEARIELR